MNALFIQMVRISILSVFIFLLILFMRFLMRNRPRKFSYMLWYVLFFRLINPFFIESPISIIPKVMVSSNTEFYEALSNPEGNGLSIVNNDLSTQMKSVLDSGSSFNLMGILVAIWLSGLAVLLIYTVYTLLRLNKNAKSTVRLKDNIFAGSTIPTPFIMGLSQPRVYVPSGLSDIELDHIIAHENYHIRRKDHWLSYAAYFITMIYWFNPLVWMAYYLFLNDMETSCDEGVLKEKDVEYRKLYATTLLRTASRLSNLSFTPGFMKGNMKMRIKSLLKKRKYNKYDTLVFSFLIMSAFLVLNTTPILASAAKLPEASQLTFLPEGWQNRLSVFITNNQIFISRSNEDILDPGFNKNQSLTFQELADEFIDLESGLFIHDSLHFDVGDKIYVSDRITSAHYDALSDTTTFTFKSSTNENIYFKGDLRREFRVGNDLNLKFDIFPYISQTNQFEILDYNYTLQIQNKVPEISDYLQ